MPDEEKRYPVPDPIADVNGEVKTEIPPEKPQTGGWRARMREERVDGGGEVGQRSLTSFQHDAPSRSRRWTRSPMRNPSQRFHRGRRENGEDGIRR